MARKLVWFKYIIVHQDKVQESNIICSIGNQIMIWLLLITFTLLATAKHHMCKESVVHTS